MKTERKNEGGKISPTTFVIFGVTGDLAQRKLFPALFALHRRGLLPEQYRIVGFSRRPFAPEEFRSFVSEALAKKGAAEGADASAASAALKDFLNHVQYQQGFFDKNDSYQDLAKALQQVDEELGQCSNKLFYLSVPPSLYEEIFVHLSFSGLTIPCGGDLGWTRVLVEKPFGRDLATAQKLDALLATLFKEEQIFRIDHYLAKETLQNILAFRFANNLFEPVWNREFVDSVEVRLLEKIDLQGRGAFFDDIGSLRDVGQNHILQMLALAAMDDPKGCGSDAIRRSRAAVLSQLMPVEPSKLVRAQYAGMREERGVKPDSQTETYFRIVAGIGSPRWKGVPFILEAGKALDEARAEITVSFKKVESCFDPVAGAGEHRDSLTFRIQPNEGIELTFWAKTPGVVTEVEPKRLSFSYGPEAKDAIGDAYEKVLYDCVRGDQTLFASTEEVAAAWKFVTPILEQWGKVPLGTYEKGSRPSHI